jgi:hypothetical protein
MHEPLLVRADVLRPDPRAAVQDHQAHQGRDPRVRQRHLLLRSETTMIVIDSQTKLALFGTGCFIAGILFGYFVL